MGLEKKILVSLKLLAINSFTELLTLKHKDSKQDKGQTITFVKLSPFLSNLL